MSQAQLNVNSAASAQDLANAILGAGVSVSNVSLNCGPGGSGSFTNGNTTNIGINEGIVLTSGRAIDAIGPNNNGGLTFNQGNAFNGDTDLDNLVSGSIEDACRLEFDFVAESNFVSVQFVFGSEEYNEYVCSQFNDVFGFFVTGSNPGGGNYNGQNVALVPSTLLPVSVNTINIGAPGANGSIGNCVSLDHSDLYQNNAGGLSIQYDGFTVVLTAEVAVVPGETYHFKFAIADVSDSNLDSGVFIRSQSFSIFSCSAGIIDFVGGNPGDICANDNISDVVTVSTTSSASGDTYAFLLTDADGNILEMNGTGIFDLASYANGNYLIYGVSYDGIVSGIEVGQNVAGISAASDEGCFDLTLPLPIRKKLCTSFELVSCAPDVTVECGTDLENFEITGYPVVTLGDGIEGEVTFTHVDVYLTQGTCSSIIQRTWTVTYGDVTFSCNQTITVVDTQGPVFGELSDITVQCIEDVPGFSDVTAIDVCSGPEEVLFFESQTGTIETTCVASTAFGPGADWAVWLPVLATDGITSSANFVFDSNGGTLDQFAGGTAHLYGTIVNSANNNEQFIVDLWFNNKANWATWSGLGRNYKNDLGLACAVADHINWSYYELVGGFSTMTGAGDLAGDVLHFYHMPANYYFGFQIGIGANNKNCNSGMSGWFTYSGIVDGESVQGHGDVNVDTSCEPGGNNDGACLNNTSFTHFYMAQDDCGHATIVSQEITVLDTTAPEFTNCPESLTIECSDAIPAIAEGLNATDNCVGDVTILYLGEIAEGNACQTILTRTWSATDLCGNRSNCVQTITILDTTAPVLNGLPSGEITVECDAVPAAAIVTATDNCQDEIQVNLYETSEEGNCPGNYTIYRHWTASDDCDNTSDFWQTIHVQDTTSPVFDAYEYYAHIECNEIPATITAHDNCGEATVVVVEEVLNSGGCMGVYYRLYRATDACGNTTDAVQYISILDTTAPVLVGVPAETTLECSEVNIGENGNYFGNDGVYGTDNCGMEVSIAYTEEVVETDDNCAQSYDIVRTWVATDYCENVSTASQTVHIVDTTAPSLEIPGDYSAECSDELIFDEASAWDNCSEYTISEERDTLEGNCPNNYTIIRVFVATDACGNASEPQTQTISVSDNTAPLFAYDQQNYFVYECDETIADVQPLASDNCSDEITYNSEDVDYFGNSCYSGFTRIWSATDACGNTSYFYQYIYIQDTTGPVITGELEISRPCDDYQGTFVTATDNCNEFEIYHYDEFASGSCAGNVMRHYTAYDYCQNASLEFIQIIHLTDAVAPVIESETPDFTVECGNEYGVQAPIFSDNCDQELDVTSDFNSETDGCTTTETYTWTAVDHCNNTTVSTTVVTIVDTTNPWFENFPADQTVNCNDELPAVVYPNAYDSCDENVEVSVATVTEPGSCPQEQYIYRTFRGTDNCGNQVVETQTIHVVDATAPVFNLDQTEFYTYECDEIVELIQPVATDNCGDISYDHVDYPGYYSPCYSYSYRVWTATDECGNSSEFWQVITIVDTTAPVITGTIELYIPCEEFDIESGIYVEATDNCNETMIQIVSTEQVSGECAGVYMRTYVAYDICENQSEQFIQIIRLTDDSAPVGNEPLDIEVSCDEQLPYFNPEFTDNCGGELTLSHSLPEANGYCNVSVTETWTATDNCGNTTTIDRVITYVDHVNPWFTYVPENATYECDQEFELGFAYAQDNCDNDVTVTVETSTEPGACPASYVTTRIFTATDECGNTANATQVITVQDTQAPYFDFELSELELSYECGTEIAEVAPVAYDNCSTFELTYEDSQSWSEGCYYGFVRVWTATDACGNANSVAQYISFSDSTAPVVNPFTVEITMPCDDINNAVLISAVDNCNEVIIEFNDEHVSGGCAGKIIRTYTVSDVCGNYTQGIIQQIITLIDVTAPVIENAPENIIVECGDEIPGYTPVWNDNCDDDLTLSAISGIAFDGCNQIISQVYFAVDHCGNQSSVNRSITIVDTVEPYFTSLPEDEFRNCNEEDVVAIVTAEDVCDDEVAVTHTDVVVDGNCPANYTIERTYRATDDCGNQAVHTQYIHVSDNYAPSFGEISYAYFTYECGTAVPLVQPSATDNCSTISYDHNDGEIWVDGCQSGFVRTWYATDACGNVSYPFNQYISFEDTTEPVLTGCPTDLVIACDAARPDTAVVTASDLCDENVNVVFEEFIVGDLPAEGSIADCDLITPVRPANNPCVYPYDWAMAMFAMPSAHRWYYVSEGNLVQYPNGSVHVTATMNNVLNPSNGWLVDLWFNNGMDWNDWSSQSFPTSFKADCGAEGANHAQWMYFLLQNGEGAELTGFGGYAGSSLNLTHAPANNYFGFQLGDGANNYNGADNGFGGWFSYSGTFRPNQNSDFTSVNGAGDFAFELDCCPDYWIVRQWTATDCSGNSTTCSQTITFEGSTVITVPQAPEVAEESTKAQGTVAVAPNPASDNALFTFKTVNAGKTTLEIFDMTGSKVADVYLGVVEAGIEYKVNYSVNSLATGVYMYRLTNGSDTQIDRLIINK